VATASPQCIHASADSSASLKDKSTKTTSFLRSYLPWGLQSVVHHNLHRLHP